ncbi:MAG TPA: hypothetical protein VG867_09075 [Rhizomicrobium sp.]|nr:hypothetical protein [Rhizomicrobium sp.]
MKTSYLSATAIAFVAALSFAATTDAASARGWSHSGTFTGAYGRTVHTQGSVYRGGGQASGYHSVQGSNGHGFNSSFDRSCSGGTCTRNSTLTTNNGNTWTRSGSVTANGNGTGSYSRTTTGPNGGQATASGTWTVTPN